MFDYKGKQLSDFVINADGFDPNFNRGLMEAYQLNGRLVGKKGYVDKSGVVKITYTCDYASGFNEELATVGSGKMYSAIDHTGKVIIPHQY